MAHVQTRVDEAGNVEERHIASNISSAVSGSRAGIEVADKRANLLDAAANAELKVGRREPATYDPWPKRKVVIKGVLAGLVVLVLAAIAIAIVVSMMPAIEV